MSYLNDCYLYGAGINAYGVVKYIGKKKIKGIIDSNKDKIGVIIDDIQVISLDEYENKDKGVPIIISAFQKDKEVIRILNEKKIDWYLEAPFLQGSIIDIKEIVDEILSLYFNRNIVFDDTSLLSVMIIEELIKRGFDLRKIKFYKAKNIHVIEFFQLVLEESIAEEDLFVITLSQTQQVREKQFNVLKFLYNNDTYRKEELVKYKDLYKGKRCFVIGNGPSLKMEDLERLYKHKEICFASNKIYLAYNSTRWRPSYYVVTDFVVYKDIYNIIKNIDGRNFFVREFNNMLDMHYPKNTNVYSSCPQREEFFFSDDIIKTVYSGVTVTYNIIQIAAYMGFEEIYLLGVDFSYNKDVDDRGNHFVDNYLENKTQKGKFYYEEGLKAYQIAEKYSREHNFRIYNATRGGKLEVFQRVNFDELFRK